ncbi:MAG: hypothetical protein IKX34_06125 [Bacteroidales bacterium]|nr:hypothetical protein [Bacteroidales bacterium]
MRKIAVCLATLLLGASSLFAQSPYDYAGRFYFSVQGGLAATLSENVFSYTDNGKTMDLIKPQGSAAIGYDFNSYFGIRLSGAYAQHAGGSNVYDTSPKKDIWPFTYESVSAFADGVLNLNGLAENFGPFNPKLYAGIGGAYTYNFTNPNHPFQNPVNGNIVIGFRVGAIAEVDFRSGLGFFADLGLEAYDDWHSGIRPSEGDQKGFLGYAGFPFDLVGRLSLGIIYHFK